MRTLNLSWICISKLCLNLICFGLLIGSLRKVAQKLEWTLRSSRLCLRCLELALSEFPWIHIGRFSEVRNHSCGGVLVELDRMSSIWVTLQQMTGLHSRINWRLKTVLVKFDLRIAQCIVVVSLEWWFFRISAQSGMALGQSAYLRRLERSLRTLQRIHLTYCHFLIGIILISVG